MSAQFLQAQSKSTITIKTIKIENGDTIVTERSYNSDGDNVIIDDSTFSPGNHFIFFNNDYGLDTNFTENFSEIFSHEMRDFLDNFNVSPFEMPENTFEFLNKKFSPDFDTAFSNQDFYKMLPDTSGFSKNFDIPKPPKQVHNESIITDNIILPNKQPVEEFLTEPSNEEGKVKISFLLDAKNATRLVIKDEAKKIIFKEKIHKSKGIYTRIFDFNVFPSGNYILELKQGNKQAASRIMVQRPNNNFHFIF